MAKPYLFIAPRDKVEITDMTKNISSPKRHAVVANHGIICYFIRHAEAEPVTQAGDAARPLTKNGRHDAREIFAVLADIAPDIDCLYSSPLLRARQTAELLASALRLDGEPEIVPILTNGGPASEWVKFLQHSKSEARCVAAVGHEPTMGRWLAELCFESDKPVLMKKCAIAKVRIWWGSDHIEAELEGLYQPGFMRKMARRK